MPTAKLTTSDFTLPTLAASTQTVSPEYDVTVSEYAIVGLTATADSNGALVQLVPVGLVDGVWMPFPEPTVAASAAAAGTVDPTGDPPYSSNVPSNLAEAPGRAIQFTGEAADAGEPVYCGFKIPVHGVKKLAVIIVNGPSDLTDVTLCVGAGSV